MAKPAAERPFGKLKHLYSTRTKSKPMCTCSTELFPTWCQNYMLFQNRLKTVTEASPLRGSHVKSKATHLQHGEVRGKKPTHVKGTQKEWSLTVPLTDAEQLLSAQGSSTRMAKIRNPFKDGKQMEMHFDFWLISATPHYLRIKLL